MKRLLFAFVLVTVVPWAHATDEFCDTGSIHPIDLEFAQEIAQSSGVTVEMRNAQGGAHERWDKELNRVYGELMSSLSPEEKVLLRDAQRA